MRVFLLPALLIAAGCAVDREARVDELAVPPPAEWSAGREHEEYAVEDEWWTGFGDSRLDAYIVEAITANPSLDEAEARVRTAAALARIAGAELYPAIGAGGQAGRSEEYIGLAGAFEGTQTRNRYGVALNLSWELDLWGRIRAGEQAAVQDLQASRALFHGVALSLAAQSSKAYFAAIAAERQIEVARANFESARFLAQRISERFQRGLRTALDVKLAETEVSRARSEVARRELVSEVALRQLESLLGRYPGATVEIGADLPEVPEPVPAGVPADVIARRPDLIAAELRVRSSASRVFEAEASLYPRISLTASGGLASSDIEDMLDGKFMVWSIFGNLVQPIFQGGRLRANVSLTEAQEDEAVAAFANAVLNAFGEVENALAGEHHLARQERALAALVDEARTSAELSEMRYLSGLTPILSVLEARRRHFTAQSQYLNVRRLRLEARVDLFAALGGGFHKDRVGVE